MVLFADTFNNWFEPENLSAAMKVLEGRYTFFEADLIDPAGEGPMLSTT